MTGLERRGARRGALLLATTALLTAACGVDPLAARGRGPLDELERLAFVARGRTPRDAALDVGVDVDLLVDRFEVTREHWLEVQRLEQGPWGPGPSGDLPATHVLVEEARTFARRRGMRLPTDFEWLWCAVGPRASPYPFTRPQAGIVNMRTAGLDLGRPTPVGTFEAGRTPDTGLYDLHGNVRELTLTAVRPEGVATGPVTEVVFAAGGSFDTPPSPTFGRVPQDFVLLDRISGFERLSDVGLRCVAPAAEWLRAHGAALARSDWRERVVAVGRRWGGRAAPLLTELAAEPGAPEAFAWLLEGAQ